MTDHLITTVDERVMTLTLNRPERRNALTDELMVDLGNALMTADNAVDVNVVVLTGAGPSFCSGADFSMMTRELPVRHGRPIHELARTAYGMRKPLIAAVNGPAVGAGLALALMADLRFMSDRATASEGYINVGLFPGGGDPYYLPRLVGDGRALSMFWTGDPLDAAECYRIGLATQLFRDDTFLKETMSFARRLASRPQTAIRAAKSAVRRVQNLDLSEALDLLAKLAEDVNASPERAEEYAKYRERHANSRRTSQ